MAGWAPMPSVMWFRRDLRLSDNPALLEAAADGDVLPLFVLDPALWGPAGPSRRAYLAASLRALDASLRERGRTPLRGPRRPGAAGRPGRAGGRRRAGPRRGRHRALRPRPRRAGRGRPRRRRRRAGPHRLGVRRGPGPRPERLRRALPRLHAVLEGLDRPRLARPRGPAGRRGLAGPRRDHGDPRPGPARRPRAAGGRRGRGRAALGGVPRRRGRGLRRGAQPARASTAPPGCRCT